MATDILIYDGAVRTEQGWLSPGYVAIQDGRIQTVAAGRPDEELLKSARQVIRAEGKALIPGLTNGHTHFSQTFMRGLAAGRPLLRWLKELIWPLQSAMSVEEMRLAALLGLVENLKCGCTSVVQHHKVTTTRDHTGVVMEAAKQVGINCVIARLWSDKGVNSEDATAILDEMEEWFALTRDSADLPSRPFLHFASGPATPWRCSADCLQKTHDLAVKNGSFTHIHVAETRDEIQMSLDEYGLTPIRWLDTLGILGPQSQIVHAVWVDEGEIELLARRGALVVHCPVSNAVMGSGIAPIPAMLDQGVTLRLGSDGPASNDTQDLFETTKMALSLARAHLVDASVLQPAQLLSIAVGGQDIIPGSVADLILVNLAHERAMPVHDLDSALVLCSHGSDVDTVIVRGNILMKDRRLLHIDEEALLKECIQAVILLRKRAGLD
ncbi:MAG: amidohydrolase [Anaerolineae bacterium]|nr:amidohydrolase [Anaerolineae bacterium]